MMSLPKTTLLLWLASASAVWSSPALIGNGQVCNDPTNANKSSFIGWIMGTDMNNNCSLAFPTSSVSTATPTTTSVSAIPTVKSSSSLTKRQDTNDTTNGTSSDDGAMNITGMPRYSCMDCFNVHIHRGGVGAQLDIEDEKKERTGSIGRGRVFNESDFKCPWADISTRFSDSIPACRHCAEGRRLWRDRARPSCLKELPEMHRRLAECRENVPECQRRAADFARRHSMWNNMREYRDAYNTLYWSYDDQLSQASTSAERALIATQMNAIRDQERAVLAQWMDSRRAL